MTVAKRPSPVFHDQQDGLPLKVDSNPQIDQAARLFVCDQAADVDEARLFLAMLGLVTAPPPPVRAEPKPGPHERMDDRIAELAGQGLPAAAIAERLGIQVRRVATWRKRQQAEEERGGRAQRWTTGQEGL